MLVRRLPHEWGSLLTPLSCQNRPGCYLGKLSSCNGNPSQEKWEIAPPSGFAGQGSVKMWENQMKGTPLLWRALHLDGPTMQLSNALTHG